MSYFKIPISAIPEIGGALLSGAEKFVEEEFNGKTSTVSTGGSSSKSPMGGSSSKSPRGGSSSRSPRLLIAGDLYWESMSKPSDWMNRFNNCFKPVFWKPAKSLEATDYCKSILLAGVTAKVDYVSFEAPLDAPKNFITYFEIHIPDSNEFNTFFGTLLRKYSKVTHATRLSKVCTPYTCWSIREIPYTVDSPYKRLLTVKPTQASINYLKGIKVDSGQL